MYEETCNNGLGISLNDSLAVLELKMKSIRGRFRHVESGQELRCSTMAWERRGNNSYYYRKERDGSNVKSVYVGRGEIAHLISGFQESSDTLERLVRSRNSINDREFDKSEAYVEPAVALVDLFTQATLLNAGFHTHHRQWRRKRKCQ